MQLVEKVIMATAAALVALLLIGAFMGPAPAQEAAVCSITSYSQQLEEVKALDGVKVKVIEVRKATDDKLFAAIGKAVALDATTTMVAFFMADTGMALVLEVDDKGCVVYSELATTEAVEEFLKKAEEVAYGRSV